MEYRKVQHGNFGEELSVLGLGLGGIQKCSDEEIEQVISTAIDNGINFFDVCAGGKNVYAPVLLLVLTQSAVRILPGGMGVKLLSYTDKGISLQLNANSEKE